MQVILNASDVESLIKESYDGIESVTIPKDFEVKVIASSEFKKKQWTATVQSNILKKSIKSIQETPIIEPPSPTVDKLDEEIKTGVMASGGGSRILMKF